MILNIVLHGLVRVSSREFYQLFYFMYEWSLLEYHALIGFKRITELESRTLLMPNGNEPVGQS